MEVVKIVTELVDSNIYIVKNGKKGLLIDCGTYDVQNLEARIKNADVEITDVLLTHGHFDHAAGAKALQEKGYKIYIHKNDAEKLCTFKNMAVFMGFHFDKLKAEIEIKPTIKEYGVDEKDFLDRLDQMSEDAFDDQCTGANPRYPLISEIKDMYLRAYYGK